VSSVKGERDMGLAKGLLCTMNAVPINISHGAAYPKDKNIWLEVSLRCCTIARRSAASTKSSSLMQYLSLQTMRSSWLLC